MSMMTIEIEEVSCTGCGACIRECGHGGPRALRDRAPEKCKRCFHCFAVCPSGAIAVRGRTDRDVESAPVPPVGIKALTAFLASRRSTRHFLPAAVPETVLARLFEAAAYIPSGGNRRSHRFTLLRPPRPSSTLRRGLSWEIRSMERGFGKSFRASMPARIPCSMPPPSSS